MDEELHHIVRVVGIAHPVAGAQKHLGHDIGHGGAQVAQSLPRAFLQKAIGHVEGRAAPAFYRKKPGKPRCIGRSNFHHVMAAHTRCQQRLMSIAHGGVGEQEAVLRLHPIGQPLRSACGQNILSAFRAVTEGNWSFWWLYIAGRTGPILGFRMPIDCNIGNIGQDLSGPIAPLAEFEQIGRRVDKAGGIFVI